MKKTFEEKIFNAVSLVLTTLFAFICIFPVLLTISGSFTSEEAIFSGLSLIPKEFSLDSYKMVLQNPTAMLKAYRTTIFVVIVGTFLSLILTSMTAYVLYRQDCKYRKALSFYYFFTTLFSGGLVPVYILMCKLGLRNTYAVLIISGIFSVFNMIVMRTYFTSNIPQALVESARIDGAGDFKIWMSIILPASGPILATIGLLVALSYWNSWQPAMLYIDDSNKYTLQYYLQKLFKDASAIQTEQASMEFKEIPTEGYKLAMTVFTMGPVVLFYPFVQKYFVAGATIGAVKG